MPKDQDDQVLDELDRHRERYAVMHVGPDLRGIMFRLAKARVEHGQYKSDPQKNVATGQELHEATKLFDMALASWYSSQCQSPESNR